MLDIKGNEIESSFYDSTTNEIEGKEFYKYLKFDANGNWTKRITFETEENNLKSRKPRDVTYRKIIYY